MFNNSKYTKWYLMLMEKCRNRKTEGYIENHHIIPKSMGGSNKKENIISLYPKEHYIAHLLLMKMCVNKKDTQKMVSAYIYISKGKNKHTSNRYNSRLYDYHKKIRSKILSEQMSGSGNPMFGKIHSDYTRNKISEARIGINTNTIESREKKRKNWINNNPNYNPEIREKITDRKSKIWKLTDPNGKEHIIKNRSKFCRENGLSAGNLSSGKTKGWKCQLYKE